MVTTLCTCPEPNVVNGVAMNLLSRARNQYAALRGVSGLLFFGLCFFLLKTVSKFMGENAISSRWVYGLLLSRLPPVSISGVATHILLLIVYFPRPQGRSDKMKHRSFFENLPPDANPLPSSMFCHWTQEGSCHGRWWNWHQWVVAFTSSRYTRPACGRLNNLIRVKYTSRGPPTQISECNQPDYLIKSTNVIMNLEMRSLDCTRVSPLQQSDPVAQ